jgi:chemotaxis protein MotA
MKFIIGFITVFACVLGGYVLHHGKLSVLYQPTEFLIIVGAAVGSVIIGNPGQVIKASLKSFKYLFKGAPYKKADYTELMVTLYQVFKLIKSKGMLEVEGHIESPHESEIFRRNDKLLHNHHALDFMCAYLRLMTMGMEDYYQMDDQMQRDIDSMHAEEHRIPDAINTMADAMPALGIVAAVLGVIVTMGSITEPPEVLGGLIGAALVGTFLGVLLSYALLAPMSRHIGAYLVAESEYVHAIRVALLAHLKGNAPVVSVEFARCSIEPAVRPAFAEVEDAINNSGNPAG